MSITPEHLRQLSRRGVQRNDGQECIVPARDIAEYNVALRAAADQLETVQEALTGGSVATPAVVRVANARRALDQRSIR